MQTIEQTYFVKSSISEVWKALTDASYINAWGGGPAKMDDKKGTKFSFWGGSIWGENKEVVSHKRLVQAWTSEEENKWENPSTVSFTLSEKDGGVEIKLTHIDVPDENAKDIDDGWRSYYLGPLKKYIESK